MQVITKAVGDKPGELKFRYYPAMPGNSTCHVQEKLDLQGESMPEWFFEGAQDVVCPVTTISQIMQDYDIDHIDLLKVSEHLQLAQLQYVSAFVDADCAMISGVLCLLVREIWCVYAIV